MKSPIERLDGLFHQGWEWTIGHTREFGYRVCLFKHNKPRHPLKPKVKILVLSETFGESLDSIVEKVLQKHKELYDNT